MTRLDLTSYLSLLSNYLIDEKLTSSLSLKPASPKLREISFPRHPALPDARGVQRHVLDKGLDVGEFLGKQGLERPNDNGIC